MRVVLNEAWSELSGVWVSLEIVDELVLSSSLKQTVDDQAARFSKS